MEEDILEDFLSLDVFNSLEIQDAYYSMHSLEEAQKILNSQDLNKINNQVFKNKEAFLESIQNDTFESINYKYNNLFAKNLAIQGYFIDGQKDFMEEVKRIVSEIQNNLKPIYFSQIPKFTNNKDKLPLDQDFDINNYSEMYSSYEEIIKKLNANKINELENVLFYDERIFNKDSFANNNDQEKVILEKLKQLFIKNINVKTKQASSLMFLNNANFNELKELNKTKIYEIYDQNYNAQYFLNYLDAVKALWNEKYLNIKQVKEITEIKTFLLLNDQQFFSRKDLDKYIEELVNNAKVIE